MLEVLDSPADGWDNPDTGSAGWNRIIAQAGPEYTWEWLIMDRTASVGRPVHDRASVEGRGLCRLDVEAVDVMSISVGEQGEESRAVASAVGS